MTGLKDKTAYRFRVKQCDLNNDKICSLWSDWKILSTSVSIAFEDNEYAYLYARGTGVNNHNSSIIKVDDFTILNHAYYRGLYLVVLSRYDLSTKFRGSFDTVKAPEHETLLGSKDPFYNQ
jgi:hypothetical protein